MDNCCQVKYEKGLGLKVIGNSNFFFFFFTFKTSCDLYVSLMIMEFSLNLQTNKHFLLWNRNIPV